jgi:hypothetical protein
MGLKNWFSWKARFETLATSKIKALRLQPGDIVVFQSDEIDEQILRALMMAGRVAKVPEETPLIALPPSDSIEVQEIDQAIEWLQNLKASRLAEQSGAN